MRVFISIFMLLGLAAAQVQAPEPPRVFIDSTYQQPAGKRILVHANDDLQAALDRCKPGETIVLDASAIFTGNFKIPAKTGSEWIYIETSDLESLPPAGTRVSPSDAASMPKIVTPNAQAALTLGPGANHIRLVGIELYSKSGYGCIPDRRPWSQNCFNYYLTFVEHADSITFDRVYVHGSDTQDVTHGIGAKEASNIAIVDSYIADIHGWTNDSQAFLAWASSGPFKLINNYFSASTEDVMFGGAGGYANTLVPSDIEVRDNTFEKPLAWIPMTTGTRPWKWQVKNNLECKSCLRMVVTGNTFRNAWKSGQTGSNILLTPRTGESGVNSVANDIDIENNTLAGANMGFSISGFDETCGKGRFETCTNHSETKRVRIAHNTIQPLDLKSPVAYHPMLASIGPKEDNLVFESNTMVGDCWASLYFNLPRIVQNCKTVNPWAPTNVWVVNNKFCKPISGDCGFTGQKALDMYIPEPPPATARYKGNH